jgi:hypothetical protein
MQSNSTSRKPVTMPHTSRQKLTTSKGVELERQSVYAPAETWAALHRLCVKQQRSGSQIIQSLIALADLGNHSKENNDQSSPRRF